MVYARRGAGGVWMGESGGGSQVGSEGEVERASFMRAAGEGFLPEEAARSPWSAQAINGFGIAGLLTQAAEHVAAPAPMLPARITIEILGPVPFARVSTEAEVVRSGRSYEIVESRLIAEDRVLARARTLRAREAASPALAAPSGYPPPEACRDAFLPPDHPLSALIETRAARGAFGQLGGAAAWTRMKGDLVAGQPVYGTVHAAMVSDLGHGLARAVEGGAWTFANLDIALHMVRRPVGEWILVDSEVMLQGLGVGLTNVTLADRAGVFAKAHQTLLISSTP